MSIELVSLDMAGTTIDEGGTVYRILEKSVMDATQKPVPADLLAAWSGTSKHEAIVGLLDALGDDVSRADDVFARFSDDLAAAYDATPPAGVPGVAGAFTVLREAGIKVALQTGYTRDVAESLLDAVGWKVGDDVDALVTADDVPESRPAPYLIFRTMERTGVRDVRSVLVAGDTANDLQAGTNAGAGYVVGVLTGAYTAHQLGRVRHTHIVDSVASLPALLETP